MDSTVTARGGSARGRAAVAVVALTIASTSALLAGPVSAATPSVPITLGIHDGAINMCDRNGAQTTPPTPKELAAASSSFTNRYWAALKVATVRFSPPWDICLPP